MTKTDVNGTWAVLADIHGNAVALEAVLAVCAAESIARFIVPGDLAWGPDPRTVVESVMGCGGRAVVVRGNADREVADPWTLDVPELRASTEWCARQLTVEQRTWLRSLPDTQTVAVAGTGALLVCHGTPTSDSGLLRPDLDPEAAALVVAGVGPPVVICGHSHVRFDVRVGGHRIVNPGSVGLHYGQVDARWATVGPDGITMRTTSYDRVRAAELAERSGNPAANQFAAFFRDPVG